jgi:hypothetical protein
MVCITNVTLNELQFYNSLILNKFYQHCNLFFHIHLYTFKNNGSKNFLNSAEFSIPEI